MSPPGIAFFEVVEANGGVDQALVEKAALIGGVSPEVFPGLVGFEVLPGIKKNYSLFEEVVHADRFVVSSFHGV